MGMYRFLRSDFKITVKLNSTPYHQGTLAAYWQPPYNSTVTYADPQHFCGLRPVILSASLQDTCDIIIPYMFSRPHWDLSNYELVQGSLFSLRVLNPLLTSSPSVADVVPVTIFCQMVLPHVYGYNNMQGGVELKSQSSGVNKHKQAKEAQAKDKIGLTASGVLDIVKPVLSPIPFATPLLELGAKVLDNLDKPASDQSVTYVSNRSTRGHSLLTGVDYSEPLSSFPSLSVAKFNELGSSDMDVLAYAQLPNLYKSLTFSNAGILQVIPSQVDNFSTTTRTDPDYLAYAAMQYTFWRGSIRYLVHMVGTAFYSCRLRFSVIHSPTTPTAVDEGTNFYSKIVDVKGDAWTTIEVPYLSPTVWSRYGGGGTYYRTWLVIEALTAVQGSSLPADAIYYVNIFRGAGSDMQFSMLCHGFDPAPMKSQCSIFDKFKEPFDGIQENIKPVVEHGIHMADTASTITDSCKRYVLTNAVSSISYPGYATGTQLLAPLHRWAFGFAYWRGSRRFRLISSGTHSLSLIQPGSTWNVANGIVYAEPDVFLSCTVPWYCQETWYPTWANGDPTAFSANTPIDVALVEATGTDHYLSAGDDFCYLFPIPYVSATFKKHMMRNKPSGNSSNSVKVPPVETKPLAFKSSVT
jgi:hypothetical protein